MNASMAKMSIMMILNLFKSTIKNEKSQQIFNTILWEIEDYIHVLAPRPFALGRAVDESNKDPFTEKANLGASTKIYDEIYPVSWLEQ